MRHTWQVQEAKNRFSELLGLSSIHGPQTITRHGKAVAQIVAIGTGGVPVTGPASSAESAADGGFTRHLLNAPHADAGLPLPARRNRKQAPKLGA